MHHREKSEALLIKRGWKVNWPRSSYDRALGYAFGSSDLPLPRLLKDFLRKSYTIKPESGFSNNWSN